MKNFSNKISRENQNTHFMFNNLFITRYFWDTMCENIAERGRPHTTIWRIRSALWIPRATDTNSEYVILNDFPLEEWLNQRPSKFHYAYIACIVTDLVFLFISDFLSVILADPSCLFYNKLQLESKLLLAPCW